MAETSRGFVAIYPVILEIWTEGYDENCLVKINCVSLFHVYVLLVFQLF